MEQADTPSKVQEVVVAEKCNYKDCPNIGTKLCGGCKLQRYCSLECQKNNWPEHRRMCKSHQKTSLLATKKNLFTEALSYDNQISEAKKAVDEANLTFYQTVKEAAKKILSTIGVIFGRGGVRVNFRLAKDLNKPKKDGKVNLAIYYRNTQTILVTFLDISKENVFLFTLIHEMLHAWFHQVAKYHPCVVDEVDQEEEGACELFAYLLLCKKFEPSYTITLVSNVELYKDAFKKLKKELKIPDDPSNLTYEEIKNLLHEYVKRRN